MTIFGPKSRRIDRVQRGPCAMTEGQIFSHPAQTKFSQFYDNLWALYEHSECPAQNTHRAHVAVGLLINSLSVNEFLVKTKSRNSSSAQT